LASVNEDSTVDMLGRYLPEESYYSTKANSVKPKAYLPPGNLKLSTCCIDGLNLEQIWQIGQQVVEAMNPPKVLFGVGKLAAAKVRVEKLVIINDGNKSIPQHNHIKPPISSRL
jgi:hypothetical protein